MRLPPPIALTGDPDERNYKSEKFATGTLTTVSLWHDYICPWCYVGFFQAQKLAEEYGLIYDWRGTELIPPSMEFNPGPPKPAEPKPVDPDAPPKPKSRFDLFAESEGYPLPTPRPTFSRSHRALLGQEFVHRHAPDLLFAYNEAVYRAYWEKCEDIADLTVLARIAASVGLDETAFVQAIEQEQDVDNIVPFDDEIYAVGIRHVPTFIFSAEELLAEAPYVSLAAAADSFKIRAEKIKQKAGLA